MENYEAEFYQLELVYNKICNANKSILSIEELRKMIETLSKNTPWNMKSYSECLYRLNDSFSKLDQDVRSSKDMESILELNQNFLNQAKHICQQYIEPLKIQRYNSTKYTTQYRKEHYKQLNVDLLPEDKDAFVEAVEYNGKKIKQVLREFILNYISETNKKKEQDNNNNT